MANDLSLLFVVSATYIAVLRHTYCMELTLSNNDILENTDIQLRCSDGNKVLTAVRWTQHFPIPFTNAVSFQNNICTMYPGFLNDVALYSHDCTDGKTFTVTLKSVSRVINGQIWSCDLGSSNFRSNEVIIYVKVPVSASFISPSSKTITESENATIQLHCTTSECRPEPKFTWYKDKSILTDGDETILSQTSDVASSATTIQTYTNYFSIKLSRDLNAWYIFCSAGNYNGGSVPSNKIMLNVTYPPDRPPRIGNLLDGSEVKSIQGENVDLVCSITGGNPPPALQWNRNNDSPMNIIENTVTKAISWLATGTEPVELICRSHHPYRNDSVKVKINILYSPGRPEIWLLNSVGTNIRVNKTLYVIEGRAVTLNCSAKSNPPVSLYKWNELMPTNISIFRFENYDRNTKTISCYVSNEMKTSNLRPAVTGNNATHIAVNVLYPPTVNTMSDRTVVEGADIVYLCNFAPGNPTVTNVTWSWNDTTWNDRLLIISNVTMHHKGVYRCDVRNMMMSSDGTTEIGYASGKFYLSVENVQSNNNGDTSPTTSSVNMVAASAAGTVGGVLFLAALITILMVYKRRKRLSYQKREMSIQYYNCNDSKLNETISTKNDNANAYESFHHTGSDEQYDSLSPEDSKTETKNDCQISAQGGNLHVYEGLQAKDFDQQYETISPSTCKVKIEQHKVYENLQL